MLVVDKRDASTCRVRSRLAEFQTPTVFDRDFDFHHSIFKKFPKIVKILIYIFDIHENASMILF